MQELELAETATPPAGHGCQDRGGGRGRWGKRGTGEQILGEKEKFNWIFISLLAAAVVSDANSIAKSAAEEREERKRNEMDFRAFFEVFPLNAIHSVPFSLFARDLSK